MIDKRMENMMSDLTSAQYLELAKIREFGMKQNKNLDSIKQRQEKEKVKNRRKFWREMGLNLYE